MNRANFSGLVRLRLTICALLAGTLFSGGALAQSAVRFIYVAPDASFQTSFGNNPAAHTQMWGAFRGVEITAANAAEFQRVAPPKTQRTYAQLQRGQALRTEVDKVLTVSDGDVAVVWALLIDDRTGLPAAIGQLSTITRCGAAGNPCPSGSGERWPAYTAAGNQYVWPQAMNEPDGASHRGIIWLGEVAADYLELNSAAGVGAWDSTIMHEMSHTQFIGDATEWGPINGIGISYGADGSHSVNELMGSQNLALDEGLGNFFGDSYTAAEMSQTKAFFNRADERYFVEARSFLAGVSAVYQAPRTPSGDLFFYLWDDVPGYFLQFSEITTTMFLDTFIERANGDRAQAFNMVIAMAKDMHDDRTNRYLTYAVNRLALQLEDYARTPQGQTQLTAGTLTSSLFPFALLDLVTHFGMTEEQYKAAYRRNYPDRNPRAWTEYWGQRAAIQALVAGDISSDPVAFQQALDRIHTYCRDASRMYPTP